MDDLMPRTVVESPSLGIDKLIGHALSLLNC